MKKKIVICSTIFALFIIFCSTLVLAQTTGTINFSAVCESEKISNMEVAIYKIGVLNNDKFEFTQDFADCNLDKDDLSEENIKRFEEFAINNVTKKEIKTTDSNGRFKQAEMELGTYLLVQNNRKDYCTMQTMLINIPEVTSDGETNYIVNAEPKISLQKLDEKKEDNTIIEEPNLPYTGTLGWLVSVLAVSGIVIFAVAWIVFYSKKKVK